MKFNKVKEPFRALYSDNSKYKVVVACRGGGKTIAVMQYGTEKLLKNKNYKVIFFSSTLQKAEETIGPYMREVEQFFSESYDGKNACTINHNKTKRLWEFDFGGDDIREVSLATYENPDKRRGSHPDLIILDEASLMDYHMFDMIIDPMLAHLGGQGEVIIIGAPAGQNKFYELYKRGLSNEYPEWSSYCFKASDSGLLDKEYVESKRGSLSPEIFEQEYECSFEVSMGSGYVYSQILYKSSERINSDVTYNVEKPVYTSWDLGHSDYTSVWFFQTYGNEVRFIDYYEGNKEHISTHAAEVLGKNYVIKASILPHDSRNKTTSTMSTVEQVLSEMGLRPVVLERANRVWPEIEGTKGLLRTAHFNDKKCEKGLVHLKNYKVRIDPILFGRVITLE
ncbi:MAG: hypothetical protein LBB34_00005 [Holosporales bacterium]|jgi:hypothetical protein|nr:hypothetical protein [Holosporales bacterium]